MRPLLLLLLLLRSCSLCSYPASASNLLHRPLLSSPSPTPLIAPSPAFLLPLRRRFFSFILLTASLPRKTLFLAAAAAAIMPSALLCSSATGQPLPPLLSFSPLPLFLVVDFQYRFIHRISCFCCQGRWRRRGSRTEIGANDADVQAQDSRVTAESIYIRGRTFE
ncbi:hypothetical protein PIB30_010164 [Stylosanthes scabra]|uniref:Secreted protein n=1 Tax=Stylosanthes scabra TaxID=79078 RepID=A0ABU6Q5C9_9FABA|nr:hypothetical protein [Stylosanthes scabra]